MRYSLPSFGRYAKFHKNLEAQFVTFLQRNICQGATRGPLFGLSEKYKTLFILCDNVGVKVHISAHQLQKYLFIFLLTVKFNSCDQSPLPCEESFLL